MIHNRNNFVLEQKSGRISIIDMNNVSSIYEQQNNNKNLINFKTIEGDNKSIGKFEFSEITDFQTYLKQENRRLIRENKKRCVHCLILMSIQVHSSTCEDCIRILKKNMIEESKEPEESRIINKEQLPDLLFKKILKNYIEKHPFSSSLSMEAIRVIINGLWKYNKHEKYL